MRTSHSERDGRFWQRMMETEAGCWEWQGPRLPQGYGRFTYGGVVSYAHRVAFQLLCGPIPDGLCVCHRCDNPPCCRPDHLFLGTRSENALDRDQKGRGRSPGRPRRTHCLHGHPFDESNTAISAAGRRSCCACNRRRASAYRAQHRKVL